MLGTTLRRAVIALSTLGLAVGLGAAPAAAISSSSYQSQIMTRTNAERVDRDRVKLKHQTCIDSYAQTWARTMAADGKMRHQSSSKLKLIMKKCKLNRIGENIAAGYSSGNSVTKAWMKSPGHRKNILNTSYRRLGIGASKAKDGTWWSVQIFGTPR